MIAFLFIVDSVPRHFWTDCERAIIKEIVFADFLYYMQPLTFHHQLKPMFLLKSLQSCMI